MTRPGEEGPPAPADGVARYRAAQREGKALVRCAWEQCTRPSDLLTAGQTPHAKRFHAACKRAYLEAGGRRRGDRAGAILFCARCGGEIGYRNQSHMQQKYCRACALALLIEKRRARPLRGEWRPCSQCGRPVYREPSNVRPWPHIFCGRACQRAWQAGQPRLAVTCVECGAVQPCTPSRVPRTADRAAMTWTCPRCRPRQMDERTHTCAQCRTRFTARYRPQDRARRRFCSKGCRAAWQRAYHAGRRVTVVCAYCLRVEAASAQPDYTRARFKLKPSRIAKSRLHFCGQQHRSLYYAEQRYAREPCRHCGRPAAHRGHAFCDRTCYAAWMRGRPAAHRRADGAARRILEAWRAGVRGVRALAKESHASVNTVRKLQQAGLLADAPHAHPPRGVLEDVSSDDFLKSSPDAPR